MTTIDDTTIDETTIDETTTDDARTDRTTTTDETRTERTTTTGVATVTHDAATNVDAAGRAWWDWWLRPRRPDGIPPIVVGLGGLAAAAIGTAVVLNDPDVPTGNKIATAIGIVLILLVLIGVAVRSLRRRSATFASVVDSIALTFVVLIVAIAPALLVDRPDQILLVKIGSILILSLLPGLIYLQYLSSRGEALWEEFTETLRRLHVREFGEPPREFELSSENNIYRRKFEAKYGRLRERRSPHEARRSTPEGAADGPPRGSAGSSGDGAAPLPADRTEMQPVRRGGGRAVFPVFLLTVLLAVGWTAALEPEVVGSAQPFGDFEATGDPGLSWTALQFGFAGAYFFIVQMIVRRYFQNDLSSDAYFNGVLRLIVTLIGAATIAVVFAPSTAQLAALAFLIGVFPQAVVDIIRTAVVFPIQNALKQHREQYPLSMLDGMNVWYEARLLEEGIEDLQNLKTTSWVQLLLNTRIPPGRLVDWVDQSHLLLHISRPRADGGKKDDDTHGDRERLARYGIRTATDLEAAFYSARQDQHGVLDCVLDDRDGSAEQDGAGLPSRVVSIIRTLAAEPVLVNVRAWKNQRSPSDLSTDLVSVTLTDRAAPPDR